MKKLYSIKILFLLLLIPVISAAQSDYQWLRGGAFGSDQFDEGFRVAIDDNENTYVAGYLDNAGSRDVTIFKWDANSNLDWTIDTNSTSTVVEGDRSQHIEVDDFNNIYVLFHFYNDITVNHTAGSATYTGTFDDILLAKFDDTGALLWAKVIGSAVSVLPRALTVYSDCCSSSVYVSGYTDGDVVVDGIQRLVDTPANLFISRFDQDGNFQWMTGPTGVGTDTFAEIRGSTADANNVFVTGFMNEGLLDFTSVQIDNDPVNVEGQNMWVLKLNISDGSAVWGRQGGGQDTNFPDQGIGVEVDAGGTVYVSGMFEGSAIFSATEGVVTGIGMQDMFMTVYDFTGGHLYTEVFGSIDNEWYYESSDIDDTGKLFFAIHHDTDITVGSDTYTGWGNIIFSYDPGNSGAIESAQANYNNWVYHMDMNNSGSIAITGYTCGTVSFPSGVTFTTNSSSCDPYFSVLALPPDLNTFSRVFQNEYLAGQYMSVSGYVQNWNTDGYGSAPSTILRYYISDDQTFDAGDTEIYSMSIQALPTSDNFFEFATTIQVPPGTAAGTYYLVSVADADDTAVELDETNNESSWFFTVSDPRWTSNLNFTAANTFQSTNDQSSGDDEDKYNDVAIDDFGNIFAVGSVGQVSGNEMVLEKWDLNGNHQWSEALGTSAGQTSEANAVAVDEFGNIYVVGRYEGLGNFGRGFSLPVLQTTSSGNDDIFIAKYDPNGDITWVRTFGTPGRDIANGIALDDNENVYVTGSFDQVNTIDFDGTMIAGSATVSLLGGDDMFALKLDTNGNLVWAMGAGSDTGDDVGFAVAVNPTTEIAYVAGDFNGSEITGFGSTMQNAGQDDIFLFEYNSTGSVSNWRRIAGAGTDRVYDIIYEPTNNRVIVVGEYDDDITATWYDSFASSSDIQLKHLGNGDTFISSHDGSSLWPRNAISISSTEAFERAGRLAVDGNGNVFTTGFYFNQLGPLTEAPNIGTFPLGFSGQANTFVTKMDAFLNPLFGGNNITTAGIGSAGVGIDVDVNGNIAISGIINGSADYNGIQFSSEGGGTDDRMMAVIGPTPELTIFAVASRGFIVPGEDVSLYLEDSNDGQIAAGAHDIRIFLSTDEIGDPADDVELTPVNVTTIPANDLVTFFSLITIPGGTAEGSYYIIPVTDYDNAVNEAAEDDNAFTIPVTITNSPPAQNIVWEWRSSGDPVIPYGADLDVNNGDIVVAGLARDDFVEFPGGNSYSTFSGDAEDDDSFIARYDASGNFLWANVFGGQDEDEVFGLTVDGSGNSYVTGRYLTDTDIEGNLFTSNGGYDMLLAKFDNSGNLQWVQSSGGTSTDTGWDIGSDNAGDIYVTGYFRGPVTFNTATLNGTGTYRDMFLIKYDGNGNVVWAKEYLTDSFVLPRKIFVDKVTGETFVVGTYRGTLTFGGTVLTSNNNSNDIFVAKFDFNGDPAWAKSFGGPNGTDYALSVAMDQDPNGSNLYIGGYFWESADFDGTMINAGGENTDLFVAKLTASDGTFQWAETGGSTNFGLAYDIDFDADLNVFVTGYVDSDYNIGGFTSSTNGFADMFLAQFAPDGTVSNFTVYGGTSSDRGQNIMIDNQNNMHIVGTFNGVIDLGDDKLGAFDPGLSSSSQDFFIVRAPVDLFPPTLGNLSNPTYYVLDGSAQSISIDVTDNQSVNSVDLEYTGLDDGNTFYTPMANSAGDTYSIDVGDVMNDGSNNATDRIGYQMNVFAYDEAGNQTAAGVFFIYYTYPNGLVVNNSGTDRIGFGTATEDYRMFSIPLNLQSASANDVIGDEFGTDSSNEDWAIYRYSGGSTTDFKSRSLAMGEGYWLLKRTSSPSSFSTGQGNTANVDFNGFTLSLQQGWNQIGNPYNFILSWTDVLNFNGNPTGVSDLAIYTGTWDQTVLDLWPGEGAMVFLDNAQSLDVPTTINTAINTRTNGDRRRRELAFNTIDAEAWNVVFNIESSEYQGLSAGIGMNPEARESKDQFDRMRVPRFGKFLDATFEHPEYFHPEFASDVVPSSEEYIWNFKVENNLASEDVTISWENDYFGVNELNLVLFDLNDNVMIDMREQSEYTFRNLGERQFKVYYGNDSFIQDNVVPDEALVTSYPNPFVREISFQIGVPVSPNVVQVDIYNSLGQWVTNIQNGELAGGFHDIRWDGRNNLGARVNDGLYLYKVIITDGNGRRELNGRIIKR